MQKNTLAATHAHNLKFLKSTIQSMDVTLKHLSNTIGAELHASDASLSKISGHSKTMSLATPRAADDTSIYNQLVGKLTGVTQSGNGYKLSQSQLLSEFASSLSKAMKRNL